LTGLSLKEAELQQANFTDSYCGGVDFSSAHLLGANFTNATLTRADFTNVHHLTAKQLANARNLYDAKLDPDLAIKVHALNPSIFERPPVESSIESFFEMYTPELMVKDWAEAMKNKKDEDESDDDKP
jgi:Pentapeptide repeats (8 copies)